MAISSVLIVIILILMIAIILITVITSIIPIIIIISIRVTISIITITIKSVKSSFIPTFHKHQYEFRDIFWYQQNEVDYNWYHWICKKIQYNSKEKRSFSGSNLLMSCHQTQNSTYNFCNVVSSICHYRQYDFWYTF